MPPLYEPQASQTDPILTAQLLWTHTVTSCVTADRAPTSMTSVCGQLLGDSVILSSQKAWLRARLLLKATHVCTSLAPHHFCGSWHTGARRHPSRMAYVLDPTTNESQGRPTREDGPSNVPKAQCEGEVHAVCFSIYGTLGEPHLALSMSSLMYSQFCPSLAGT